MHPAGRHPHRRRLPTQSPGRLAPAAAKPCSTQHRAAAPTGGLGSQTRGQDHQTPSRRGWRARGRRSPSRSCGEVIQAAAGRAVEIRPGRKDGTDERGGGRAGRLGWPPGSVAGAHPPLQACLARAIFQSAQPSPGMARLSALGHTLCRVALCGSFQRRWIGACLTTSSSPQTASASSTRWHHGQGLPTNR